MRSAAIAGQLNAALNDHLLSQTSRDLSSRSTLVSPKEQVAWNIVSYQAPRVGLSEPLHIRRLLPDVLRMDRPYAGTSLVGRTMAEYHLDIGQCQVMKSD